MTMDNLEEIKRKNAGKWIALKGTDVIASSRDYHELHRILKEMGVKEKITVIHSPSEEEKKYGFLLIFYEI